MNEIYRVNKLLEKLGSIRVVYNGDEVHGAILAILEAIPGYIEREIERKMKEAKK